MSMTTMLILVVIVAAAFMILKVMSEGHEQSALLKALKDAGARPGETERLMSESAFWHRRGKLLTDRETHFIHELLRVTDAERWYLCPQVRVADIVRFAPAVRPRSRTWWKLFSLVSKWHCDVMIVDRATFEVIAAVELDGRSELTSRADRPPYARSGPSSCLSVPVTKESFYWHTFPKALLFYQIFSGWSDIE
ncbi:DUF2726 domain-containing protein [Pantoea coffeiphila]|uniref:DUF2726 domain-containing protein n=1 Tax=Pantoea coffeiphila TaxID=1465635 RepID=A0A2S9I789_9GAMM|nr:DUF2726 domain-containing protein [Pantoea coffeiphila]PRD13662.1 hypothetical protein CQW29_20695 [Pantoea coffeiphila]